LDLEDTKKLLLTLPEFGDVLGMKLAPVAASLKVHA
jgi:hypothetical protein